METVQLFGAKAAGRVTLVDDGDREVVMAYRWTVWEVPERNWGPYPITNTGGGKLSRPIMMHKLLTGWPLTDHIDHDGLNNQRHNLRPGTRGQNLANQRPIRGGTSRYKGVCWHPASRKWRARIKANGRGFHLGMFISEEEAAIAYDRAAVEVFGEFACLNFPLV